MITIFIEILSEKILRMLKINTDLAFEKTLKKARQYK